MISFLNLSFLRIGQTDLYKTSYIENFKLFNRFRKIILFSIGFNLILEIFLFNARSFELIEKGNHRSKEFIYTQDNRKIIEENGIRDIALEINDPAQIPSGIKSIHIRGKYLFIDFAVLIYAWLGIPGLTAVYTLMVQHWLKKLSAGFYFGGLFILYTSTVLLWAARIPFSYEVAVTSGFCFSVCGLALVLFSIRKSASADGQNLNRWLLTTGCFSMACAVGCRPMTLFHSLFILPLIIPYILQIGSDKKARFNGGNFLCVLILYLLVGSFLDWYNAARFGSPLEFGIDYQITSIDAAVTRTGPTFPSFLIGIENFIFGNGIQLTGNFPYIEPAGSLLFGFSFSDTKFLASCFSIGEACPLIYSLLLLPLEKNKIKAMDKIFKFEIAVLVFISFLIAGLTFSMIGIIQRYAIDFYWAMALAGLMAFFILFQENISPFCRLFFYSRHFDQHSFLHGLFRGRKMV